MTGQSQKFTKEFRREAVRLSRESGRIVREIAEDLGVGMVIPYRTQLGVDLSMRRRNS